MNLFSYIISILPASLRNCSKIGGIPIIALGATTTHGQTFNFPADTPVSEALTHNTAQAKHGARDKQEESGNYEPW